MPTINDRIGSQNVIRVLSNASAAPSRVNNLLDVNAARKDDADATGLLLIWDTTSAQYILGNDITHGLNITGLTTFTRLEATGVTFSGVTTTATLSATTGVSMGATSIINIDRQLQNIASLDSTTTATIEAAVANAPNTFTNLEITGISTFIGPSGHVGLSTFGGGINVVAGVSTFAAAIDANAGANIAGGLVADTAKISDLTQANAIVFSGSDGELVETSAFTINSVSETLIGQNFTGTSLSASRQFTAALLNVTGVSTFAGISTFNNNVFVEATTDTNQLNVTGVSTFVGVSTFSGDVYIGGDLYLKDDLVLDNITGSSLKITGISTFGGAIDGNAGADISGGVGLNVVGHTELDNLNVSGVSTFAALLDANLGLNVSGGTGFVASTAKISDLTSGRVVYSGASGELQDSANLTFDGTELSVGLIDGGSY